MQIITNNAGKELKKHGDNAFPFLVSYERLSGYETGSFLWHWHPEIELTYVKKGEMLYKVNQNTFHLKEGQALFGNANALHAGYMYQNQDCQYIPVTFDPKLIYGFSGSALFQKYTEPILRSFSLSAVPLDFSCDWHQDAVEDILLEMAELLADQETTGKKLTCQAKAGKAKLHACGRCEEDGGVYIETLTVNDHEYVIDDYFL